MRMAVAALGLCGEAGAAAELFKKYLGHGHPIAVYDVMRELGDLLWYVAELASVMGVSLDDIAETNVEKLKRRYPDGFSEAASMARVDVSGGST